MNSQDILRNLGISVDVELDNSETYDYEIAGFNNDYDPKLLDFTNPITFDTPILKDLSDDDSTIENIKLCEFDNRINDINYIYSSLTVTFNYDEFTDHFNILDSEGNVVHDYENFILNNDLFTYTGITNEIHYFVICEYSDTPVPTSSPTPEPTNTETPTPTETIQPTPNPTLEPTPTETIQPTPNPTLEPTPNPTSTEGPTSTPNPTSTLQPTPNPTSTEAPTPTPNPTSTNQPTPEPTSTLQPNPTPVPTSTVQPTPEPTSTVQPTPEPTSTVQPTPNPTSTIPPTLTPVPTSTEEPTATPAPTSTEEPTPLPTSTLQPTPNPTVEPTPNPTSTEIPTPIPTSTQAPTPTPNPTSTNQPTPNPTSTIPPTLTPNPTSTNQPTPEPTSTIPPTLTPVPTSTVQPTPVPTSTPLPNPTSTPTPTNTETPTPTVSLWVPTPDAWFDASDTSSYTLSGSNLSSVNDKAGNFNMSVDGSPTRVSNGLNNKNVWDFNGSESLISANSGPYANNGNHWAIGVFQYHTTDSTKDSFWSADGNRTYAISSGNSSSVWYGEIDYDGSNSIVNGKPRNIFTQSVNQNAWVIVAVVSNKTDNEFYGRLNGSIKTFVDVYNNSMDTNCSDLRMMRNRSGVKLDGRMAEYFHFADYVGGDTNNYSEVWKAEGYLAHKWGLTSVLPSNHPYKNNPPTV